MTRRWNVRRSRSSTWWWAESPDRLHAQWFPSHREAFDFAFTQASGGS